MKTILFGIIRVLLALFILYGGLQHFVKPGFFIDYVPSFLPYPIAIIYVSGGIEIILGVTLLLRQKQAQFGALGVLLLMLLFLPIHIWDVFSETPAIGSHNAALIRLLFQFVLILLAWKVYRVLSIKKIY